MIIRKLFGAAFAGDALTNKVISPTAIRTTAEIHDFIQQGIDGGLLDFDKDGKTTALGDGLMVIRNLFGAAFSGAALTDKAISPDSPLLGGKLYTSMSSSEKASVAAQVAANIQQGVDSGLLDVDKDNKTTALGDGLMVIRRLFGAAFDGAALTNKAISPDSPYFGPPADFAAVAANIDALKPTMPVS